MKYKLFAADFDGTLYGGEKPCIPEENIRAIHEYIKLGGKFIIATGRMYRSIRPHAIAAGLSGDIIAYQGASVYDIETSELKFHIPLSCDEAARILKYIESFNYHCQIYYNDIYYVVEENDYTKTYSRYCGIPVNLTHMPLSEYIEKNFINPTKIMAILPPEIQKDFFNKISEKFKGQYGFARSSDNFIEIISVKANKGVALNFLIDKYGIKREEIAAIGDSTNDIPMIKFAGLGIAVGNAMDELKEEADLITVSSDDFAVKNILEKIMRDEL